MADWATISALATAGGTLVLAVATFSSVRSANASARVAERSLLAGLRPVLIPTREHDPEERITFGDQQTLVVPGGGGVIEEHGQVIYLAMGVRNGGSGLGVIHAWRARRRADQGDGPPDVADFRRQQVDIYVPAGDTGRWLGALRDPDEGGYAEVREALDSDQPVQLDLLFGDHEGGQRTIVRFVLAVWPENDDASDHPPAQDDDGATFTRHGRRANALRYWNLDREDPR
jgi:hypothetical protein